MKTKSDKKIRVVVTGLGVISSLGFGKDKFWENIIQGKSGISKVESFDTSDHSTSFGGEIKDFNPYDFINKNKAKVMARASHFAIAAAKLAFKDAKFDPKNLSADRIAVFLGTTGGESQKMEEIDAIWHKQGIDCVDVLSVIQYPVSNIASNVALEFKARGKTQIFTTACSSGNYAIGYGYDLLKLGKADMIIAGGSDAFSYLSYTGFNQVRSVAPEICQPFDKNRRGMIPGEGSGILILETLESALKRNAHIYAEIAGYGLSCDAYHMTNPQIEGVSACMDSALKHSGIEPEDIDYISAHGTGTRFNDRTESVSIKNIFGDRKVPVSSIKSMLGHTMGAASAIEALTCCMAIENSIIPPTINYQTPDPECDIDCVPNTARKKEVNIVLNNGFAFGGNNASIVIKKFKK